MSRFGKYFNGSDGASEAGGPTGNPSLGCCDDEISQLTTLKSAPHEHLSRMFPGKARLPISPVKMLMGRECNYSGRGRFSSSDGCHVLSRYLPVNGPSVIDKIESRAYVSQFSADGSLFIAGFQDRNIRIYNVDSGWKIHKDIQARSMQWTITDASLSPDRRFLVYSSLSPMPHIVNVEYSAKESLANVTEIHEALEFSADIDDDEYRVDIFSVKFSNDGRELVASGDELIYVYDLEAKRLNLSIPAHMSDVNAACFADESGHIIYSGSDDHLCKVWDRRCFVNRGQAAGVLMGHLEGITFIDTRGDGRYFISNGKDQSIKLWDIRKMSSDVNYTSRRRYDYFDYRRMEYPEQAKNLRHPDDLSLATYRGHSVLHTLIRCYFSPEHSTGQKYIYTGSADGSVYIYDVVSGDQVAKLDFHDDSVRDCNWHPYYPMIVSSSWDGLIAGWEFPGECQDP